MYDDTSEPKSRVSQSVAGVRSRSLQLLSADDFTKLLSKYLIIPSDPSRRVLMNNPCFQCLLSSLDMVRCARLVSHDQT